MKQRTHKECPICKRSRRLDKFYVRADKNPSGYCKECARKYRWARYRYVERNKGRKAEARNA